MSAPEYTREELISLCERGVVPCEKWSNRDTADAQRQLGEALALLRAGCAFRDRGRSGTYCVTDERTVWVDITFDGFNHFDWGGLPDKETFYIPTAKRLADSAGRDWC